MPDGQIIEHEKLVGKQDQSGAVKPQAKDKELAGLAEGRVTRAPAIMG